MEAPALWAAVVREALFRTGDVPAAARMVGVCRRTMYRWLTAHPELRTSLELRRVGRPRKALKVRRRVRSWRSRRFSSGRGVGSVVGVAVAHPSNLALQGAMLFDAPAGVVRE